MFATEIPGRRLYSFGSAMTLSIGMSLFFIVQEWEATDVHATKVTAHSRSFKFSFWVGKPSLSWSLRENSRPRCAAYWLSFRFKLIYSMVIVRESVLTPDKCYSLSSAVFFFRFQNITMAFAQTFKSNQIKSNQRKIRIFAHCCLLITHLCWIPRSLRFLNNSQPQKSPKSNFF